MKEFLKKHEDKFYTIGCSILSFAIPFIIALVLFTKMNFTPFGDKSMTVMMYDMQSQYVTYMRYYRECLLGNVSSIYTHSKVFGGDFMSIFSYYLASPFNYFVVFVSSSEIPQFFAVTSLIKISLTGLFMYFCLRFTVKKDSLALIVPSIGYALISYSFLYLLNFMWLDGVMILPIVILGMNKLVEGKVRWIYPLGLAYALMTSWYIGALICIFAVIYFVYKTAATLKTKKELLSFASRFAIFSLIGGLLASPFWLTAFMHLGGTKGSLYLPEPRFTSVATFFEGFLEGNYADGIYITHNTGFFSMFTSAVTLVFFQLFFFNKKYTLRERLITIGLPVLFFFVCNVTTLNALFHGGREPTWFPGRYTFMIGFLVCYFAGLSLADVKSTSKFGTILPFASLLVVYLITKYVNNDNAAFYELSWPSIVIYITSDVLAAICIFMPDFKNNYVRYAIKTVFGVALIAMTSLSSYRGSYSILKTNLDDGEYEKYETYLADEAVAPAIDALKAYDSSVYRMETLFDRPGTHNTISNNPLFYSYNGLNHFSSSEKEDAMYEMLKLGFHFNHFFEKYDTGSTAAINSFLGMKYLVDNSSMHMPQSPIFVDNYPWSKVTDIGYGDESYTYYQNALALPFAFTMRNIDLTFVPDQVKKGENWYVYNQFEYQNELFKQLTNSVVDGDGKAKDIFKPISTALVSKSDTVSITTDAFGFKFITGESGDSITFKFTAPAEGIGNNL
ncbi:MAG: YfhO family protein, partial [Bacilli bacterium]|nr:YfhO family protein [Bacilli bacterium]